MKRRTLLKSMLALPLVDPTVSSATPSATSQIAAHAPDELHSGLAGLDYAMSGLKPGELTCFTGSPCTGKTILLLELATRLVNRYGRNVFFYGANEPLYYLCKKMAIRCGTKTRAEEICDFVDYWDQGDVSPGIVMIDFTKDSSQALSMVKQLASVHPAGCAALIMDGWSTYRPLAPPGQSPEGVVTFPAERWPHGLISTDVLAQASRVGADLGVPVVFGVTTAALNDDKAQSESHNIEAQLRIRLDHLVRLAGSSRHWWDTRYAKLRFDPRRLGFATVV
jgi:DnaB-like helicase C terminal domain